MAEMCAAILGGAVIVLGVGAGLDAGMASLFGLALYGLGAGLAALGLARAYPHAALGLGNTVTLMRLALISGVAPLLLSTGPVAPTVLWFAFAVAALALSLDGVDGWAARRAGLTSDFGARFDMEVDAGFALLLAAIALSLGHAGAWVLALGLPRYLFVAAGWVWPWLQGEVADRFSRKAVCVLQVGVLVFLLIPDMPTALRTGLGIVALCAVAWSFARDIAVLRTRRG